jgi:hypothetical protein
MPSSSAMKMSAFAAAAAVLAFLAAASCVTANPDSFKREAGYYYGVGSGDTKALAAEEAKRDLAAKALAATKAKKGLKGGDVALSADALIAMKMPKTGAWAVEKVANTFNVVVRMKIPLWEKYEEEREAALRAEFAPRLEGLADARPEGLSRGLGEASALLESVRLSGFGEVLTEGGPGSPLMTAAIESFVSERAKGAILSVSPEAGFIGPETAFTVTLAIQGAAAAEGIPLFAEWSRGGSEESVIASLRTGPDGKADMKLPSDPGFKDRAVRLRVSTDFSRAVPASASFKALDASIFAERRYCVFEDVAAYFAGEALVAGGKIAIGAPPRDKRATKKEAQRAAEIGDFYIDSMPVTNALYGMYLEDALVPPGSYPDYWDNPEYSGPRQPVVGVRHEDAVAFAAWLSERLGATKRLPTEAEWEAAARGGRDAIYPWGDELPSDGERANYKGNGKFDRPSPVGEFRAGENPLGLFDMAGNVWQWTSTPKEGASGGAEYFIAKGGSWMDGPADLRVSNRKELRADKPYADVGFRLVREVSE